MLLKLEEFTYNELKCIGLVGWLPALWHKVPITCCITCVHKRLKANFILGGAFYSVVPITWCSNVLGKASLPQNC